MSGAISVHHGEFGRAALYELDKPIITHAHREAHLIFWLDGGAGRVRIGDEVHPIDRNRGVAVSPWAPHNFEIEDPANPLITLTLYVKPNWFLEQNRSNDFALAFGSARIDVTTVVSSWVNRLTSLLMDQESSDLFDPFLFETTRQCYEQSWTCGQRDDTASRFGRGFLDFRVRRSIGLMQQRFREDMQIDWLAKESGLSRPHFFKLFKKQMGITPNLYLNTLRAEQAIDDLMGTRSTVTDIAYDLGFASQASFTRFFTTNVGIPPSDYRRVAHIA
ncbi:AraC family transcriptional regulator [Ahrensia sp. R2A130]|uniref:AraC family transcriptional regulator n=1 Tax=Ahrensia sp. R2A130 TaxID=744979 RepID=UPI00059056C6|nr:AraC family transcriptional regulator [Ahrensia sp. R2A130]